MKKYTTIIVVIVVLVVVGGMGYLIRPRTAVDTSVQSPAIVVASPEVSPTPSPSP